MQKTDLSAYNNSPYTPGGNALKKGALVLYQHSFFKSALFPFYGFKVALLRAFGAKIGRKVELKPSVNIKYPWNLTIGDEVWIGENVWLDSLAMISIGSNVCISQGATLLTGSHNYKKSSFDLITRGITLEDGAWIGAGAIVNLGVTARSHAVLTAGSVATRDLEAYGIYQGNPAVRIRERIIE